MRSTRLKANLFSAGAALLTLISAVAQIPATVKGDRTNLRAKPGFDGEILGSLKKGDVVSVIGEVDGLAADGKTTRSWSKVALPTQVPVWLYRPLIDNKTKAVKSGTVNLRAGPGRNYSEIGKVSEGTTVTIVRSLEDWIQIEPPTGTYAYVASSLLDTTPPPIAKEEKEKPAAVAESKPSTVVPPAPKPTESVPAPTETKVAEAPALKAANSESTPTTATTAATTTPPAPAPVPVPAPAPVLTAPATVPAQSTAPAVGLATPSPVIPAAEVKPRHVIRDGVVGGTISVQAPGYYELRSIRAEGVVDYLVSDSPDIDLGKFHGKAVTVSGEEWRDVRWKTPVLKVKSIESAF